MTKQTSPKFAPEVRERAVRMVFEHVEEHASQWAARLAKMSDLADNLASYYAVAAKSR